MDERDNLKSGERRNATVLFSDMKGFTSLSERMDPEEIDMLMTRIFSLFESIITRYEGEVEKYIGDALVAVFGAGRIHEDDPARAVNAAYDFIEEIHRENHGLKDKQITLSFRTGIHTGLITTGKRGKFDVVTGHTMNVASRLQEKADANTVYVSSAVKERCEADFIFSDAIPLHVRGAEDELTAYRVQGRNPSPALSRVPYVGHEDLLSEMLRAYLRHDPAGAGACMITGEAGIGKTELAGQFLKRLRGFPGFGAPVLYARAQKFRPIPFPVVIDLITDHFGIKVLEDGEGIIQRLESKFGLDHETAEGCCRLIENSSESRVVDRAFLILHRLLQNAFSRAAGPYPPVVFIDNVHHLDQSSRDFFRYLLGAQGLKPYFLFTGREIPAPLRELFPDQPVLALGPLSRDESIEYVKRLWPECTDEDMLQTILKNSLGNPLFIREYVKLAKENRDTSSLPMTIQNIFLMSLEKYPEQVRNLTRKLSVFFLSFTREDAEYIERKTEGNPDAVMDALERLSADGVLGTEGGNFFFRHDVFKKALYNSLLNYNKKILHRHVASLLMESATPHLPRLLQHLLRAEDYTTARQVLLKEPGRFFNTDYLKFIDTILENTDRNDHKATIECLFTKSAIMFNAGKTEAMDSILKQILQIAVTTKNFEYAANAYHLLTAYNVNAYAFDKALFCGTKAIHYYRQMPNRKRAVNDLLRILSLSELLRNHREQSAGFIAQMDPDDSPDLTVTDIRRDAFLERHLLLGEYGEALKYLPPAEPERQERQADAWFYSQFSATKLFAELCDWKNLTVRIRKMLKVGTKHYSILSQIQAQLAVCCHVAGDRSAADESFAQAELYLTQIRNDFDMIDAMRTLSGCYRLTGNGARAEAVALDGVTRGLRHSSCYPVFTLLILLAELSMKKDASADARFFIEEASFYVELGVLLSRQDLVTYHYVKYLLCGDWASYERSRQLLEEEKRAIGTPRLVEAFMATRSYSEIERVAEERSSGV